MIRLSARRRLCFARLLACGMCVCALAHAEPDASAEGSVPLSPSARREARLRFDRGLALYNVGDLMGALAEFRRAYELTSHPVVLYNVALVQATLGHAAEAVAAFEKLGERGMAELGSARAARAQKVYEEQLLRVGTLEVRADVPRAQIAIDNLDVARTPAPPLRVTAGSHLVGVSAPGHEPQRLGVMVAGGAHEVVDAKLVPLEETLAHLSVECPVPDVEVRADGQLLGRTPLESDLAFKPGRYEIELTRAGFVPVRRRVTLYPGGTGKLDVPMVPDDAGLSAGGTLTLAVSEPSAVVLLDGEPRLDYAAGMRLPLGRHSLRVRRAGFFDVTREALVHPGGNLVDVTLLPTPEYLDAYAQRVRARRTWSYLALGAGAAVLAGSGAFLIWNHAQERDAQRRFDDYAAQVAAGSGGHCQTNECQSTLQILADDADGKRRRDVFGWVGVGVGGAAVATGFLLYAIGDAPARYEPRPESDLFASLRLGLAPARLALSGVF